MLCSMCHRPRMFSTPFFFCFNLFQCMYLHIQWICCFKLITCGLLAALQRKLEKKKKIQKKNCGDGVNDGQTTHYCADLRLLIALSSSSFNKTTLCTSSHFGLRASAHTPRPYNLIKFKFAANNKTTASHNNTKKRKRTNVNEAKQKKKNTIKIKRMAE